MDSAGPDNGGLALISGMPECDLGGGSLMCPFLQRAFISAQKEIDPSMGETF